MHCGKLRILRTARAGLVRLLVVRREAASAGELEGHDSEVGGAYYTTASETVRVPRVIVLVVSSLDPGPSFNLKLNSGCELFRVANMIMILLRTNRVVSSCVLAPGAAPNHDDVQYLVCQCQCQCQCHSVKASRRVPA